MISCPENDAQTVECVGSLNVYRKRSSGRLEKYTDIVSLHHHTTLRKQTEDNQLSTGIKQCYLSPR